MSPLSEREQELEKGRKLEEEYPEFARAVRAVVNQYIDVPDFYQIRDEVPPLPAGWDEFDGEILIGHISETLEAAPAKTEPAKPDKRRAFKEHKLKPAVIPPAITLEFSDDWRQHPGMPDLFIHRGQFAIQQRASRRKGIYWKPVARQSHRGRDYFVHWKRNKRVMIPVYRAMYECGHWFKKKD